MTAFALASRSGAGEMTLVVIDEFLDFDARTGGKLCKMAYDQMFSQRLAAFADIGELEDAAARGQARRAALEPMVPAPAPIAVKPVVARVAGEDIRRFLPRRAV